jgi:hypothetical protein
VKFRDWEERIEHIVGVWKILGSFLLLHLELRDWEWKEGIKGVKDLSLILHLETYRVGIKDIGVGVADWSSY